MPVALFLFEEVRVGGWRKKKVALCLFALPSSSSPPDRGLLRCGRRKKGRMGD